MDESASQSTAARPRGPVARYIVAGVALGLLTYGAALIATLPARWVAGMTKPSPLIDNVAGTVWAGEAALPGGHRLTWQVNPLTSLFNLGLSADWALIGQGTDLTGEVLLWPANAELSNTSGTAAWNLLRAMAPAIDAECDLAVRIDLDTLVLGAGPESISGELRSGPASCAFAGQASKRTMPALKTATSTQPGASVLRIVEAANPARIWAEMSLLPDRRVAITMNEPALELASNTQPSGPVMLEFGF